MNLKYAGSLLRLQQIVLEYGIFGDWHEFEAAGGYQFRSSAGEIMNWWPSTGTIFFQGRSGPLRSRFMRCSCARPRTPPAVE